MIDELLLHMQQKVVGAGKRLSYSFSLVKRVVNEKEFIADAFH